MGQMMEEKQGSVAEIIFYNQENGYTIAVFETEEEQFTAVGNLPSCHRGSSYILRGQWKIHPTYGEQFAISGFEEVMPSTEDGIQEFLASGVLKGIGKKTAAAIVAKFGNDTFEIIEKQPQRLTEIDGIGEKKAEAVAEAFRSHREFAKITLYLQQFGINADYAMKLYRVYGSDTIAAVEENPYRLAEDIFGIGFKKADKIAEKMGIARDDEHRIKSGVKFTLWYFAGEGNTFLPQRMLCEKAGGLLDVESDKINDCLVEMAFQGDVHIENLENRNVVFLMPYYLAEQNVCKCLAALNSAGLKTIGSDLDSLIAVTEKESGIALSENQKYAVKTSLNQGVSVITGGPGTGKTTIINSIIKILQHSGHKTAIAAPTGRAAKRITETSGYEASTIHRLLEYYYSEGEDTMRFGKTAEDPLDYDAVIIDEASMIDLMLMNGLASAIKPGTRLILVGDADQLPSVGAGNVLRDIINSEYIYCVKLTEIFRQAKESLIVVNAHKINRGEYPDCNEKGKDFFMMRQKSEKDMLNLIKDLCIRRLPAYYTEIMPVRDIQILTPVRKGLLGSINLNRELQDVFNPPARSWRNARRATGFSGNMIKLCRSRTTISSNGEIRRILQRGKASLTVMWDLLTALTGNSTKWSLSSTKRNTSLMISASWMNWNWPMPLPSTRAREANSRLSSCRCPGFRRFWLREICSTQALPGGKTLSCWWDRKTRCMPWWTITALQNDIQDLRYG